MEGLIDFPRFAQTAIAMQNMQEVMRRNDLSQQNLELEGTRLKEQERRTAIDQQQANMQQFKSLVELSNDPRVKAAPELGDRVLTEALRVAGFPGISPDTLSRGRDYTRTMLDAIRNGDTDSAHNAFVDLQVVAGPKDADTMLKSVGEFQKIREYSENVKSMRELQSARFQKIHDSMSRVNAGLAPYTDAVRDFTLSLNGVDGQDFQRGLKLHEAIPQDKRAALPNAPYPVVGTGSRALMEFAEPKMKQMAEASSSRAASYFEQVQQAKQLLELKKNGEPLPDGVTERDLHERVAVGQTLLDAYSNLGEWQRDPFNRSKLKKAQTAQGLVVENRKKLDALKSGVNEEVVQIRRDAQSFRETEAGKKHLYDENVGKAQAEVLDQYGFTPPAAALASVATKYGVKVSDVTTGIGDPSKKGKVEVGIKMGQEDVTRQFKMVESTQSALDYIGELKELVRTNPAIVGKAAQFGAALAGAGQQLRAIVGLDPAASKFLNTKPRDNAEALYEVLVYALAKSMDPTGALDLKVVQHARDVLGDLSSFSTGPQQMVNKMEAVERMGSRNLRRARRRITGGVESYVKDEPVPKEKPLTEMSVNELMEAITGGQNP